jgi:hypothetical protein
MSGLSNHQPMLTQYHCPKLMDRMMERTGVNPAEAAYVDGGLAWLEAGTKCIFCRHVGKCCKWLEGCDTRTTPADFCRNSEFFRSCAEHSSRTELRGCAEGELMASRLQQLGLDPEYVKVCCTSSYQELERVCASCKLQRLCARDLARGNVESGMGSYCPNAPTIDALLVNRVL